MLRRFSPRWDLDKVFRGGSGSEAYARFLEDLGRAVEQLRRRTAALAVPADSSRLDDWPAAIAAAQDLQARLQEASSFSRCLIAQNTTDGRARALQGRVRQLAAGLEAVAAGLDAKLAQFPDDAWAQLLAHPDVAPVAFALEERRRWAREKLPPDKEALATELAVDGYHAWNGLYTAVSGRIRVPFEEGGRSVSLSVGQAAQRLSDPDAGARTRLARAYEEAWAEEAELLAAALNHLAGYRLTLYRHRGWKSVLHEPLLRNRMEPATLEAMWAAVRRGQERLLPYLEWKARLLGVERLGWFDVGAPVGQRGQAVAYDDAARFIVDGFRSVSPRLADLARRAFEHGWIEAEDRPGKDAGGFCASFPLTGESRIFLTYAGRPEAMDTLAHELGHAYHFAVLKDLPPWARQYPMNLAETASTLAEMIVSDAALKATADPARRLALLDRRLQRTVAFLMNIHARFLFELDFYAARMEGPLTVEELNGLMEQAQRNAYRDGLGSYHPLFWASKLHFYITSVPFYNFPYTFGYLFSALVYARAAGDGFQQLCDGLLRDTGRRRTEELARVHLGLDLTREAAWEEAVALVTADVDEFVALARREVGGKGEV